MVMTTGMLLIFFGACAVYGLSLGLGIAGFRKKDRGLLLNSWLALSIGVMLTYQFFVITG